MTQSTLDNDPEIAKLQIKLLAYRIALVEIKELSGLTAEIASSKVSVGLSNDIASIHQWADGSLNMNEIRDDQLAHYRTHGDLIAALQLKPSPSPKP